MSRTTPGLRRSAIAIGCALVVIAGPAAACINTVDSVILRLQANHDDAGVAAEIAKLEAKYKKAPSLSSINDLAVGRLLTRRYPQAIELLNEAEKLFPGEAIVAANLGTAFELAGNDTEALRWIREGVQRDPKEHFGTEWLHVKILEAKLALARDPDWLKSNTVLGVSFGNADIPVMPEILSTDDTGRVRTPKSLHDAIWYQLKERTKFVRPPDAVVADLYAAQGDLEFAYGKRVDEKHPLGRPPNAYEQALKYGAANRTLVELRKQKFETTYSNASWYGHPTKEPEPVRPASTTATKP